MPAGSFRLLPATALALSTLLAGCLAGDPAPVATGGAPPLPAATHVLLGTIEPEGFEVPTFAPPTLVAGVRSGGRLGEPGIWAHLDGTLYVASPGCEERTSFPQAARTCLHGPVYRSDDGGATWIRLNSEEEGRLGGDESAPANGDNEVTVDAAGTVYVSNLGSGVQVVRSTDRGASWTHIGNVTPPGHWADRQWMAAAAPGHLIVAWMGGEGEQRAVAVNTTRDGGLTWTGTTYLGEDIGWIGPVHFDPAGESAYLPFTQPVGTEPPALPDPTLTTLASIAGAQEYGMFVARTADGGGNWEVLDTGARILRTATGLHWSGVLMAPALDVTGDGTVVVGWAEDVADPAGATSTGAVVKFVASRDAGATWSAPAAVSDRRTAILPWVTGGAGDRFAISYYASDAPLDSDYVGGSWDVLTTMVDGAGSAEFDLATATVDREVHLGGLCARGGICQLTGSDRSLLDYFETDVLPDGRLVLAYAADLTRGVGAEIRFAVQEGGTLLLGRAAE